MEVNVSDYENIWKKQVFFLWRFIGDGGWGGDEGWGRWWEWWKCFKKGASLEMNGGKIGSDGGGRKGVLQPSKNSGLLKSFKIFYNSI